MSTIIVGLVLAAALFFAVKGVIRHFRGEGGCCGGGGVTVPPKKKLSGTITGRKRIHIEGMTCINCKHHVEQSLDSIKGAVSEVNLHYNQAELSMTREVTDEEIREALKGSGYEITGIEVIA